MKDKFKEHLFKMVRTIIIWILVGAVLALTGCSGTGAADEDSREGVNDMPAYINIDNTEDLKFMMDTYGLTEDELAGLDLAKLISEYGFREEDYTADEVRQIIKEQGDMYKDDGTGALFSILDAEAEGGLDAEAAISCIGFYLNAGTTVERYVFDLDNAKVYIDGVEPHELAEADAEALAGMAGKYGIADWAADTRGEEEPSTGNYAWKIVFYTADGNMAAYEGFTGDMTHLPDNFREVRDIMTGAAENAK